jgi:glutamate synthase (NADPH/NADH) small chain
MEPTPKKKNIKTIAKTKTPMREQSPAERVRNFNEVPFGYTSEQAIAEADRCLQCKKPLCIAGCPVNIDIPGFIRLIAEGKFVESLTKMKEEQALPAVCGRVCPQETQCEIKCVISKKLEPVGIGRLERFVADYGRLHKCEVEPKVWPSTGKRIAVVGAGPAGITVAGDLAHWGHEVTIFEALHLPGGVLTYGIPEFRLPKEIVLHEVDSLKKIGVKILTDYVIGKTDTVDVLLKSFDTVFVGTGAGLPMFQGIPGENAIGVFSANEYLTRVNLMKAYDFPRYATPALRAKNVVTVGGGNVAMDSARNALRLGAKSTIVYRRSRAEMPARIEEIHHAEEEGVVINILTNPIRVITDDGGRVSALECIRMELGEPDQSGRRRPVPVKGSEFIFPADTLIMAIGNSPNPLVPQTCPDLKVTKWGGIVADPETMATSMPGVYAGGDIVSGAATVISAMGQAKKAALAMHRYMMGGDPPGYVDRTPAMGEGEEANPE